MRKTFLLLSVLGLALGLQAQREAESSRSMKEVEQRLMRMAEVILNHDSTELKFETNKEFIHLLATTLRRPESYDYPFDSLKTVSRLRPADDSFRLYTWYIVDKPKDSYYAENSHYYFGMIQRKYQGKDGNIHYVVIPLMELDQIPKGFENIVTDNYNWFGALYYSPRNSPFIPHYEGFYYKLVPKDGEVTENAEKTEYVIDFVPGKVRARTLRPTNMLSYSNHTREKAIVDYYILTGWNGWDNKANFKVLDVLTFDPEDSSKAVFGAPIFYFDRIPKARALFKYSDYSAFSMNFGYVKAGPMKLFKKKMIVYDHMSTPNAARETELWELGPDGSYDALHYYGRYGGYFEWYRNVDVADDLEGRKHLREMRKLQEYYTKQDSATFPDYHQLMKQKKAYKRMRKQNKRTLRRQAREAKKQMREKGMKMKEEDN